MNLQELFYALPHRQIYGLTGDHEVLGLSNNAQALRAGEVFIAIKGTQRDGHDFILEAISRQAVALVVETEKNIPQDFKGCVVVVEDTRLTQTYLATRFYRVPSQELFCMGVTGTNGKTSVTCMTEWILNFAGHNTGVIGTIDHHLREKKWSSGMTTPDSLVLQKRLREMREAGATALAMEVSSHALDQRRADGVMFNAVVFTNLTRDHLDYHKTMTAYFAAKQKLFYEHLWLTRKYPCFAIINTDDRYGRMLKVADPAQIWTYGQKDADFIYSITARSFAKTHFSLNSSADRVDVELPVCGDYNVANAVASMLVGLSAGLDLQTSAKALASFPGVPGRMQIVPRHDGKNVFVDYAHTPDALENVLKSLKLVRQSLKYKTKIITVFGCGGERDQGKRPLMFKHATEHSDYVIVTSDNPRSESPAQIAHEITSGQAKSDKHEVILDRREAIHAALRICQTEDVILIAGKGHEAEQVIGKDKILFSDFTVAQESP